MCLHGDRLTGGTGEVAHSIRRSDQIPSVIVQNHLDHQVSRIQLLLDDPALASFVVHDLFHGDHNLPEEFPQRLLADPSPKRIANRAFTIALHLQHIPLHLRLSTFRHGRQPPDPSAKRRLLNSTLINTRTEGH